MDIKFIAENENGDFYVCYEIEVKRGIHAKGKSTAKEVLLLGIPKADFPQWCKNNNIQVRGITND